MQARLSSAKEAPAPARRNSASGFGNEAAFVGSRARVLQRKCACGGTPGPDGECAECRKKRLQRRPGGQDRPPAVPSIVHEVLGSQGRPLDSATRSFMEPRFGHDFSQVRLHADPNAAESAASVGAMAYTVGRDMVFGASRYAPGTHEGRRLIAHELAHVVQQGRSAGERSSSLELDDPVGSAEREAEGAAGAVTGIGPAPALSSAARTIQRDVGWARRGPYPYGDPSSMPSSDVRETISETISGAPAPYGAWNGVFSWDSRFRLTYDLNSGSMIVSVRIFSSATAAQKAAWERAIEGKWSNHYKLVVAGAKPGAAERRYPIIVDLQWVADAKDADYTVNPSAPGSTSGGRAGIGGTTSMTDWGTSDTTDVTHEFGHMLGNPEEYFTTNRVDYTGGGTRTGFRDVGGGVMNNPSEDPFTRHYELIRRHAAKLLGVTESRCTVR